MKINIGREVNLVDWRMHSTNVSTEIGLPILGEKIANPPSITPANISCHNYGTFTYAIHLAKSVLQYQNTNNYCPYTCMLINNIIF